MITTRYIDKILSNAVKLINKLNIRKDKRIKPLNIEDIAWHLTEDGKSLNPITLYKYFKQKISAEKVVRKPYLGIIGDSIEYVKSLSLVSKTLSIPTLVLGEYKEDSSVSLFKIVDYCIYATKEVNEDHVPIKFRSIVSLGKKLKYFRVNDSIIFVAKYLDAVATVLYAIRPIIYILNRNPFLLYPLREVNMSRIKDELIYLDNTLKPANSYDKLRYIGLKITSKKFVIEDLYASPLD